MYIVKLSRRVRFFMQINCHFRYRGTIRRVQNRLSRCEILTLNFNILESIIFSFYASEICVFKGTEQLPTWHRYMLSFLVHGKFWVDIIETFLVIMKEEMENRARNKIFGFSLLCVKTTHLVPKRSFSLENGNSVPISRLKYGKILFSVSSRHDWNLTDWGCGRRKG